jgi:hypothetical protein
MESTWAILPQVAVERAQCPPRLAGIEVLIVGIVLRVIPAKGAADPFGE